MTPLARLTRWAEISDPHVVVQTSDLRAVLAMVPAAVELRLCDIDHVSAYHCRSAACRKSGTCTGATGVAR